MTDDRWFSADLRQQAADAVRARRDALATNLETLVDASLPTLRGDKVRPRLIGRTIDLIAAALAGGSLAGHPGLSEFPPLGSGVLEAQDLSAILRLAERVILQHLGCDQQVGASTSRWTMTVDIVREASFTVFTTVWTGGSTGTDVLSDSVTGLASAAVFEIALAKEIQRSLRYHHPLALILFEVDTLKAINETDGFGVGALVLERLGVFMERYFRRPDWVSRYGPDTIAVLLPETVSRDALALAEGARHAIEDRLVFPGKDERRVHVTVSAAVVTVTLNGESAAERDSIDACRVMTAAVAGVKRARERGGNTIEQVEVARDSLSVGEAAAYLQCSPSAIRDLVDAGTLPAAESSGQLRIDRVAVEAYAERHPHHGSEQNPG